MKKTLLTMMILIVTSQVAQADNYYFITIESNGPYPLSELQEYPGRYWGRTLDKLFLSGGDDAVSWIESHGYRHNDVAFDGDVSALYICYIDNVAPAATGDILFIGSDYLVAKAPVNGAADIRRLSPGRVPTPKEYNDFDRILVYDASINSLIQQVDQDSIVTYLTKLSGEAPIDINGGIDTIHTRFSGTADNRLAAQFIKETLESYGYQADYHGFYGGNLRHVAAHSGSLAWVVSEGSEILRTTDGGDTWQSMPDNTSYALWGIDNIGPDSVWVAGDLGTIRFSSDGGSSFVTQTSSVGSFHFGVDFINSLEGWIATDLGRLVHTTNAGQNWSTQTTPVNSRLYDVCFVDNQYGWAVGRDGSIVNTTDGGANWARQTSNTAQRLYGVDFTDRNNGWVVGWGGVVRHTVNGGANWETVDLGSAVEKYHVDFGDSLNGCIVGWAGEIFVTTDGGANWTQAQSGAANDYYGVDFIDSQTGFAVGNGLISKTINGGVSWEQQVDGVESSWLNIVGTKPGTVTPSQQVIVCGHMDNTSEQAQVRAPGSDDNGSGTTGVIEAARIFAGIPFEKTIKFCLWTGEEQGLLGSEVYAAEAEVRGDTIVGVFNFDMIAWDGNSDGSIELHCGTMPSSQDIGHLFEDVITDYNIALDAEFLTWNSTDRSDHASFWDHSFPAILGIEDFSSDFNPYYHTTNDNMSHVNEGMFEEFVKAAIGSAATLAILDTVLVSVDEDVEIPGTFELAQNYPNPFNPATTISFTLTSAADVKLEIFDILGRVVCALADGPMAAGKHQFDWDGKTLSGEIASSGIYFARLKSAEKSASIRMSLVK